LCRNGTRIEVTNPFGGPIPVFEGDEEDGTSSTSAEENMALVRRKLESFKGGGGGFLRIYRPQPTAAFSPRDTVSEHFAAARDALSALGFSTVERRAGGQLAVYDANALVIDLVVPHHEPHPHVIERFRQFSGAIASALRMLSVDARVGPLAGEYCPGDYSINGEGRIKLVGVAQRINRCGYHMGGVISVLSSPRSKAAVAAAYEIMGMEFRPETFGAISDLAAEVSFPALRSTLFGTILPLLKLPPQ
jgi:octanoyl-[GcvH]:protein N-octanoyltransferase